MALLIKKKVAEVEVEEDSTQPANQNDELVAAIDDVAGLMKKFEKTVAQIKKLNASMAPLKEAEKKLKELVDKIDVDEDAEGTVEATTAVLEYGARAKERSLDDIKTVHDMLGDDVFYEIANVKLGDIDKYLTLPQRETILTVNRGARSVKVQPKA